MEIKRTKVKIMKSTKTMAIIMAILIMALTMTACKNNTDTKGSDLFASNSETDELVNVVNSISYNEDKTDVTSKEDASGNVKPVESAKPAPTPTPEVKPEEPAKPVATPAPTPTPEPPKCGAVGHSVDGTCSVCGSSYTTPVATPAPTPVPTPPPAVTCPTCGSTAHAQHPIYNDNDMVPVDPNPGDNGAGDEIVD